MGNIDDLLSQLKAEYTQNEPKKAVSRETPSPQPPKVASSPLDQLLADVKTEIEGNISASKPQFSSYTPERKPSLYQSSSQSHPLLADLQEEYKEQALLEEKQRQQEILEQQRLELQREQKKREILKRRAQEWLNKLNPKSEEGRWFEEFACSYSSRVQAAMDYLEALRETGSHP